MLKKRKNYYQQQLFYSQYINNSFFNKLLKSIHKNNEVQPIIRYSVPLKKYYGLYPSKGKLLCYVTLRPRVPSSKLLLSRFHLVRYYDQHPTMGFLI